MDIQPLQATISSFAQIQKFNVQKTGDDALKK